MNLRSWQLLLIMLCACGDDGASPGAAGAGTGASAGAGLENMSGGGGSEGGSGGMAHNAGSGSAEGRDAGAISGGMSASGTDGGLAGDGGAGASAGLASGGSGGQASSGGSGGQTGSGGAGGEPAGGSGGSPAVDPGLSCGDEVCSGNEYCCFSNAAGARLSQCSSQGCNGVVAHCISSADCGPDETCCYTHFMTDPLNGSAECVTGWCGSRPLECAGPEECPAGQQCCGEVDPFEGYMSITCKDIGTQCGRPSWDWLGAPPICRTDADCPPELPTCEPSLLLPLKVCSPP